MSPRSSTISPASAAESAEDRVAVYNWQALAGELSDYGCAVLLNLLSADECRGSQAVRRAAMKPMATARACPSKSRGANPRSSSDRGGPRPMATTSVLLIHRTCVPCI